MNVITYIRRSLAARLSIGVVSGVWFLVVLSLGGVCDY